MQPSTDDPLIPVIRAALDQTRSAACITTAELEPPGPEIVYVNPAYCEMMGHRAEDVVGMTPRIMQGPLTSRTVLDRLKSDLASGLPFTGETVNYRQDGEPFLISWRVDPVLDADGVVTHFVATQQDVTRLRRAERLLQAEQAIDRGVSNLLTGSASTEANLSRLADGIRTAVAELNDYGTVTVSGSIRLGMSSRAFQAGPVAPGLESILASRHASGLAFTGSDGVRSWIGCSLSSERLGIAGAVILSDLSDPELDFVDRVGLARAVNCARRALESVAEYERQRQVAVELQRHLQPNEAPTAPGLELCARYEPGAFATRVGGDWYDVYSDDERTVLLIGDMAGSGINAAADMGRVRLLARVRLQDGATASELFRSLNHFCAEEDLVATALAVSIETASGAASAVTAGHPPPVIQRLGSARVAAVSPGPLLGIGGDPSYEGHQLDFTSDDIVLLFTDGLVEERAETIDISLGKLASNAATLSGGVDEVCDRLLALRLVAEPNDDIALLAFRIADNTAGPISEPGARRVPSPN